MTSDRAPRNNDDARRIGSRFPTGRLLAGRYELLEPIGQGGTADVYRARDHRLDRVVAVKVLRPEFGQDSSARARFAVEARSAAALNVRNIVPVYDFGAADDGSLFIVMRYIDGPSLRQILSEQRPLPTEAALDVGRQVAEALAEAHAHGLIHRDVKPGNVLIARDGTAHLTDFGTVKALGETDALTRSGTIFGTAAYLSPEQVTGGQIGPWTDIYGLGVVLYEALSGVTPFVGDDAVSLFYRHAHETPQALSALVPTLDADVAGLVMACLAKSPDDRPADARRVAATLDMASRRIAPRVAAAAGLAEVAARFGTASGIAQSAQNADQLTEAVVIPPSSAAAATSGSAEAAAAARPPASVVAASEAATIAFSPPPGAYRGSPSMPAAVTPVARGVVQPPRRIREPSSSGSRLGGAILMVALAIFAFGAVLLFGRLLTPSRDNGGVGAAPTELPTPVPTVTISLIRTTQPTIELTPLPETAAPTPTPATPAPTSASPTPAPPTPAPPTPATPQATPPPATEPPPRPTDPPTPAASAVVVRIPDSTFVGDYPNDDTYHGRSASWVYGQLTPYNTMTATFDLVQPATSRRATVEVVGLDGENPVKNDVRFVLNGVTLYEGPNPLPNDTCCGGSGPGNWGSVSFRIPTSLLARNNEFSVSNLEPNDCTQCSKFVMVDYVEISYRTGG